MSYVHALDAIAQPSRRAILERLRRGPASVSQLAKDLPISQPAVSQHLRVLREADLVVARRDGTRRIYGLNGEGFEELRAYMESFWEGVLSAYAESNERERKRR